MPRTQPRGTEPNRRRRAHRVADRRSTPGQPCQEARSPARSRRASRPPSRRTARLPFIVQEFQCRLAQNPMAFVVDVHLDRMHIGVRATPGADRGFGAMGQIQPDIDDAVKAPSRIGFGSDPLHQPDGVGLPPVLHQLFRVRRPVVEVVVKRAAGDPEPVRTSAS